jgi:hypothetical protein
MSAGIVCVTWRERKWSLVRLRLGLAPAARRKFSAGENSKIAVKIEGCNYFARNFTAAN